MLSGLESVINQMEDAQLCKLNTTINIFTGSQQDKTYIVKYNTCYILQIANVLWCQARLMGPNYVYKPAYHIQRLTKQTACWTSYPMFIHGSTVCCWHAHIAVHLNPDLRHLHRCVLHCFWQVHEIISWQLLGIGLSDMRMGLNPDSLCLHPISSGAGSSGTPQWAFLQTMAW